MAVSGTSISEAGVPRRRKLPRGEKTLLQGDTAVLALALADHGISSLGSCRRAGIEAEGGIGIGIRGNISYFGDSADEIGDISVADCMCWSVRNCLTFSCGSLFSRLRSVSSWSANPGRCPGPSRSEDAIADGTASEVGRTTLSTMFSAYSALPGLPAMNTDPPYMGLMENPCSLSS